MKDKCIIFYGQNRFTNIFLHYFKSLPINFDEYDIYVSGWTTDVKKYSYFTDNFDIKGCSFIDPSLYFENVTSNLFLYNKESTINTCRRDNCRAYAQYISLHNISNIVDLRKYNSVYITRSDTINEFHIPERCEKNTIYDTIVIKDNNKDCLSPHINGFYLYGDGLSCYRFCNTLLYNSLRYQDLVYHMDFMKKIKSNILPTAGSPRFLWYLNAFYNKIKIIDQPSVVTVIRPGIEKYNWKNKELIRKWDLFYKLKMGTDYLNGCFESIIFESTPLDSLFEYYDSNYTL